MDGIINIYKEAGYTSSDVVAKLRGILRQKKIGHTGTLDPAAEGVLPVCLGKGTKLSAMLTDERKTYRAVLLLGVETDTQDTTGKVLFETDTKKLLREGTLTEEMLRKAAAEFTGDYLQVPPMYSALKVDGKKLVDMDRKGIEVERKPRLQHIYRLTVEEVDLPRAVLTVECSRGTYIRTLCHDIGRKLGCGGCMEKLLRTQEGPFKLEDSVRIGDVEKYRDSGRLEESLVPADRVLGDLPGFRSDSPELDRLLANGNPFPGEYMESSAADMQAGRREISGVRVYDSAGRFIGVYRYEEGKNRWKAVRIFL